MICIQGLFTPWTMKSSQGLVKYVIGCCTRLGTTLVHTKEKTWEWPWSSRSPKDRFEGLHRGKRVTLVEKKTRVHGKEMFFIINLNELDDKEEKTKRREDKRMVQLECFQNYPFWTFFFLEISTVIFLMHGHSSWPTFGLHLVRCPKTL